MKSYFILYYAIAMFFPIILFTVILNNYNENHPIQVFALCVVLYAAAGWLSAGRRILKGKLKWTAWSIIVGIVEACLLYFAV